MPRRKAKTELTLFPFLSVLAGLIAVLMLFMIVTISTRVIAAEEKGHAFHQPSPEPEPVVEPPVGVEDGIDAESYERLSRELDQLAGQFAKKMEERQELERKQQELIDLIVAKKAEMLVPPKQGFRKGVRLGQPSPVDVIPSKGQKSTKNAIFVEVKADGYTVHPGKEHYSPVTEAKPGGKPQADPKLKAFLDRVDRSRAAEYLVFLVHPNGVSAYENLMDYLNQNYSEKVTVTRGGRRITEPQLRIDVGHEPFRREWILLK